MGQLNHHFLPKIENQTHAFYFDNFTVNLIYRDWIEVPIDLDFTLLLMTAATQHKKSKEVHKPLRTSKIIQEHCYTLWHEGNREEPIKLRHKPHNKTKVVHLELFVNKTLSQEVIK